MRAGNFNANRLRGRRAKFAGQNFEQAFYHQASIQNMSCTVLPSGCKWVSANKAIPVRTPFDVCLHYSDPETGNRHTAFLDLKTIDRDTFSYSCIKAHQLYGLTLASIGGVAGYVVAFREVVIFYSVHTLRNVAPNESLKPVDGLMLGPRLSFDLRILFSEF